MIELEVISGVSAGDSLRTNAPYVTIGRSQGESIVIVDPYVSWHHGKISRRGGAYYYRDLNSTHGSLLLREGRGELAGDLARAYMNKAITVKSQGDLSGAAALYDKSIALFERLVNREGRGELANDLARTYMNKGIVMRAEGDLSGAAALDDKADAIRERLANREGRDKLKGG